jgi:Xylose isomerase-like TIM barrel
MPADLLRETATLGISAEQRMKKQTGSLLCIAVIFAGAAHSLAGPRAESTERSTKGGFDVVDEIRWLGSARICEVHLKDNPHYLGEGKIDFRAVIDALPDIGFAGWARLETDCPASVEDDMRRNLKFIRRLIASRNGV